MQQIDEVVLGFFGFCAFLLEDNVGIFILGLAFLLVMLVIIFFDIARKANSTCEAEELLNDPLFDTEETEKH